MIQMPRRSVTRFFIPLIDVLTLLFCIFLLMPFVKTIEKGSAGDASADRLRRLQEELERLRQEGTELPADQRAELERLRKERKELLQDRLAVRVLEIDPANGGLYYLVPERKDIKRMEDAQALIGKDRDRQKESKRELFYLILYPRDPVNVFPHVEQRQEYDKWFSDVAHGYDIPGIAPGKAKKP
jgi:hypothetical protein